MTRCGAFRNAAFRSVPFRPGLRIVISTTTGTGFALAKKELEDDRTFVIYNPIDFLCSVVWASTTEIWSSTPVS